MDKIEQLEKTLDEAIIRAGQWQVFLDKMETQIAELKAEAAKGEGWLKVGGYYWRMYPSGTVNYCRWDDDTVDKSLLRAGNVYRTQEEAEAYRDWLTSPHTQARRRVEMCEGFDLSAQVEVYVDRDGSIRSSELLIKQYYGGLRFTTRDQAQACIDLLGEDVIKCALGVRDGR